MIKPVNEKQYKLIEEIFNVLEDYGDLEVMELVGAIEMAKMQIMITAFNDANNTPHGH
jgi:hypothetical protein